VIALKKKPKVAKFSDHRTLSFVANTAKKQQGYLEERDVRKLRI
jgi:hypothetical protein